MYIIENGSVYHMSEEDTVAWMSRDNYAGLRAEIDVAMQDKVMEITPICINRTEMDIRMMLAYHGGYIAERRLALIRALWGDYKTQKGSSVVAEMITGLYPEEVEHNTHGEPGGAYDLDNNKAIACADCQPGMHAAIQKYDAIKAKMDARMEDTPLDGMLDSITGEPDAAQAGEPMALIIQEDGSMIMVALSDLFTGEPDEPAEVAAEDEVVDPNDPNRPLDAVEKAQIAQLMSMDHRRMSRN